MPLVKCPDCGTDVSPYAESCPKCGCPGWRISGKQPASIAVGSKYEFGKYGREPIVWRVLNVLDGKALIITDNVIAKRPYHNAAGKVMWQDCYLRQWLNNTFYECAFTSFEKESVVTVVNPNPDNPPSFAMPTYDKKNPDTEDRVFCLSTNEAMRYFKNQDDRVAKPTIHVKDQGLYFNKGGLFFKGTAGGSHWWLRSSGEALLRACFVTDVGYTVNRSPEIDMMSNRVGVRPAMWVNL